MTLKSNLITRVVAVAGAGLLAWASTLSPSPSLVQSVKQHEGTAYTAYRDPVGIPTICHGTTLNVRMGDKATPTECDRLLKRDLTYAGTGVAKGVKRKITQDQYDALVDFVYNIGETKFYKSTLLRKINAGDCHGATQEFLRWTRAGGVVLRGLVTRRAAEAALFNKGCSAW